LEAAASTVVGSGDTSDPCRSVSARRTTGLVHVTIMETSEFITERIELNSAETGAM
jgi:hypothetical protein